MLQYPSSAEAGAAILGLRQTGSVQDYTTEFQRLAAYLGWTDEPLRAIYYEGLSRSIKNYLVSVRCPDLRSLLDHAQMVDANVRALDEPKTRPTKIPYSPRVMEVPRQALSTGELDATVPGRRLTQEQKNHRRSNNLCLYCGRPGHKISKCRSKPKVTPEHS